ncbi:uncharacterized protein LOC122507739 [Leptopilina heterotoma]|uniref:uncharacterized protein LOC122501348 n=1 Tax=Leptopilina heterotoma TaxID=63436 RepID=UPI001CA82E1F|nr:uncharacterized protein LOC122501348 [Leptopilina heterotoma]XP_043476539.1 uncharacterized protein LOC122507739 [Leptopilina heterotoma]
MKNEHVEDLGNKYLISINDNKNDYAGQFIIGSLFYEKVKTYISLRPPGQFSDRFFVNYQKGKCFRQPIGRHKIGEVPEAIASYLTLPNAKKYTGHCFRRTSATLLSNSGANIQMVKQLGRWRSDIIAQGYIEHSMLNRQLIYDGLVQKNSTTNIHSKPSNSAAVPIENEMNESNYNLSWSDFSDVINPAECSPISRGGFNSITPNKGQIPETLANPNKPHIRRSELVSEKSGINMNLKKHSLVQSPTCEKRNRNNDCDNESHNELSAKKFSKLLTNTQEIFENEDDCIRNLKWSDFPDDFNPSDVNPDKNRVITSGFTTATKKPILIPAVNKQSVPGSSKLFSNKPAIKLNFKIPSTAQPKSQNNEVLEHQNQNDTHSTLSKEHNLKFDNCTFNNCVFNVTACNCISEKK